jgi:ribosome-binding protein aMBF1 (putative translation factor)
LIDRSPVYDKKDSCQSFKKENSLKNFNPAHPRCIFPKYGLVVDTAMRAKNLSSEDVAGRMGIDASAVRGWRRGFGRNASTRTTHLESILGITVDMSEPVPSAKVATSTKSSPPTDPVLPHLAAIAVAHGYTATFTPI